MRCEISPVVESLAGWIPLQPTKLIGFHEVGPLLTGRNAPRTRDGPQAMWQIVTLSSILFVAGIVSGAPIDTSGFRDGAGHWRGIRDDSRIIQADENQPVYSADQIEEIVGNILLFQRKNGGWPKDYDMLAILTEAQKKAIEASREKNDTSFDNHNIHSQVDYLAKAYLQLKTDACRDACLRGFDFMLNSQYPNGGFPQRYPSPTGYAAHITFNDGVMIGVLNVLKDAADGMPHWKWLDEERRQKAHKAVDLGVACILKCQIRVRGIKTGWCQQHENQTFEAVPARTFELASICPQDTAEVVRFLMRIDRPDPVLVAAVHDAIDWLKRVKLNGVRVERVPADAVEFPRHRADFDVVVVADESAKPIWARHYEIETNRPVFAGRDAIKKYSLAEIERERRTGTPWYGAWPTKLIETEYCSWRAPYIAFPGAEGYGRFARGGRGGDVYHVTNLQDDGPGSLREGIRSATGPRTIVFDLSGTIELKSRLTVDKSYLTIAGQSAPGDGICLKDQTFVIKKSSHIIVRYLRVRLGDKNKPPDSGPDGMTTDDIDHVIFDHLSVSWGIDGNHDLRRGGNFTLQWSIYAEALNNSLHEKGQHAMLASFRDLTDGISIHHNLFASSRDRHPTIAGSPKTKPDAIADFRNNAIYNLSGATNLGNCRINVINNYYRPGPDTPADNHPLATKTETKDALKVFLVGNEFEGNAEFNRDNWAAVDFRRWNSGSYLATSFEQIQVDREFDTGTAKPQTDSAIDAYDIVLKRAGASRRRDSADVRLVEGVISRTNRLIDSQDEVGGWPNLDSEKIPQDTDQDGMPDDWEIRFGLSPKDPTDRNGDQNRDGFTNLEEYLNSL